MLGRVTQLRSLSTYRSLSKALREPEQVQELVLRRSEDLLCKNLLCEKVGEVCICRLSAACERLPALQSLDLADNSLEAVPEAVLGLTALTSLDLSHNKLTSLPEDLIASLPHLKVLKLEENQALEADQLECVSHLLRVRRNQTSA